MQFKDPRLAWQVARRVWSSFRKLSCAYRLCKDRHCHA